MEGCTHGSTAGFHLQTRDADRLGEGRRGALLKEQKSQREEKRKERQINSDRSAGEERERERGI